jgi:integrase
VLEAARCKTSDYNRWLPWICCFTGCRLDEPAGASVRDIEQVGSYWVLNIRLDYRHKGASIKNESSVRRVPLHPKLIQEGFLDYVRSLPENGPLFPMLRPDKFGSKGGNATKRIGPMVRGLADIIPSLADKHLSPNHSWRHRLIEECRRIPIRQDIEDALAGHAQEGSGPGYGEFAINDMLGPAIEQMRSPFDIASDAGDEDIGKFRGRDGRTTTVERVGSDGGRKSDGRNIRRGRNTCGGRPQRSGDAHSDLIGQMILPPVTC